jgi:hypothetical protein
MDPSPEFAPKIDPQTQCEWMSATTPLLPNESSKAPAAP